MARQLTQFNISSQGDGYLISIETDDGQSLEAVATYDQLDVISESIEEVLDEDEDEALEVEKDAEEAQ